MPLFECRGLRRAPWFASLDLALEAGEIVVLSGPSGSGKTLLLRSLADLDPLDAGEVRVRGRERCEMTAQEWRSRVVYLHQDPVRLPGTVAENLACTERLRARPPEPPTGIPPDGDALRLSGGEAQRVALQRALAIEPEVLLLDEAGSALDRASREALEAHVSRWVQGGRAALWVAHDSGLAARIGAREVAFP